MRRILPSIGVDGGVDAALVVIERTSDGRWAARQAIRWKPVRRQGVRMYSVVAADTASARATRRVEVAHPWQVGRVCREVIGARYVEATLSAEDVYIGKDPRAAIVNVRTTQSIINDLHRFDPTGSVQWVQSGTWRKTVFRRGWWSRWAADAGKKPREYSKRQAAKQESMDLLPRLVFGLNDLMEVVGKTDHVTDAAGVSLRMLMTSIRAR